MISRAGQIWHNNEINQLLSSIKNKKSIYDISIDHGRTIGAINARRKKIAINYWFNYKKSIDEINRLTGLTKIEIEDEIKRHKLSKEPAVTKSSDMKELIEILKDIQSKLSILIN
jgi:hypothetical protein